MLLIILRVKVLPQELGRLLSIDESARYADAEIRVIDASAIIRRLRVGVIGTDGFPYEKLASISMRLDRRLDSDSGTHLQQQCARRDN